MRPSTSRIVGWLMLLSGVALAPGLVPSSAELAAQVTLEVDLSERRLYVYDGGDEPMNSFEVAVGEPEHRTPDGSFEIDRIIWNPGWVPPEEGWAKDEDPQDPDDPDNPMVMAKLYFDYPDYYIHGTDASSTLGEAASHGCIRMHPDDVKALAEFVQAAGGAERDDEWFDRVARDDGSDHEVELPEPVRLEVHG